MMRFVIAAAFALVLVVGGAATGVSAQEIEPEVSVDNAEPEPGDTVNVTVGNLDPDTAVNITLGDNTADGVADADGMANIAIDVPDEPGEIDGIVTVNGAEVSFAVLVRAADGTAVPSAVNTGDGPASSSTSAPLYLGGAALLLLSGGALALHRRQAGTSTA